MSIESAFIRPYKILFVTHDTGRYGAARSLQTFLRWYNTRQIDLLINRRLVGKNDIAAIRNRFGSYVSNIWEEFLPFDRCFEGKPDNTLQLMSRNLLSMRDRRQLLKKIADAKFDFIYLNSLVLHPLVEPNLPFVVHVREIFDGTNKDAARSLDKARGVIFIDRATKAAFPNLLSPWTILNNPFDVPPANPAKLQLLRTHLDADNRTIFAMIGVMTENKGTEFVIDCFRRVNRQDALLLIVGNGTESYEKHCRRLANDDSRIVFHGFEEDVASIYAASDYVVRGEAYSCIGRTIYEGLYSGCAVVVPGTDASTRSMFEHDRFKDYIHFYSPRHCEGLGMLFRTLNKLDPRMPTSTTNVAKFTDGFDSFLTQLVKSACEPRSLSEVAVQNL
jgi:glycosyltransferase involved in cell wall biosynthesis